ncbi:MAG: Phosphinothricin N-acetyltransferase [Firmicutes bacterium ADurb.Bin182]|nr:MAG: Phosphinothricin N-acetyltransferase [Firmicutes bacterium ADurb.Bin182]
MDNIKIRLASLADCAQILIIYTPFILDTAVSFESEVPSPDEFRKRMAEVQSFFPWLVAESEGMIAGYAYASKHRDRAAYSWSADCSVYVRPEYQGKGIGTALYACLFEILKLQGFYSVFAGVSLPNAKSCALHESMGFYPVGIFRNAGFKFGRWIDTKWYGLILQEPVPNPVKLKPIGKIGEASLRELFRVTERMIVQHPPELSKKP